jgi:UDP-GlcNAc:undecaprenyl-phosphate GlcNAc-1-phosphate transferase
MNSLPYLVCAGLGLLVTLIMIPIIRWRSAQRAVPTGGTSFHHTHKAPISRLGGVALATAFALISVLILIWFPVEDDRARTRLVIVFSSLAMFGLGLWDDLRPLGARKKLIGQVLISAAVCYFGVQIEKFQNPFNGQVYDLGGWGSLATILWLVALTNMINLIDGIDGLAGGIALMMMGLLVYVGRGAGLFFPILAATGMFGALLGFLRYNFPPAKIYLGDGGAYFLGFLIGILTLVHSQKGTIVAALIAPLFALALPILDVSLAILRRGLKGLPIFRPDRDHLHHHLQGLGFSRTRTVLILYGLSSVFLLMAFGVFWSQGRWVPILFGFLCLVLILSARSFSFSRDWFAVGRVLENSLELRKQTHYALALARWLELEAERAETVEALWADFAFTVKKMGFVSVTLKAADWELAWQAEKSAAADWHRTHELNLDGLVTLEFGGVTSVMSNRVFYHLSELAAESWFKAAGRWRTTAEKPFRPVAPGSHQSPT